MLGDVLLALVTLALVGGLGLSAWRVSERVARRVWLLAFVVIVYGGITTMSAHAFIAKWGFRGDEPRTGLEHMIDGTAHRPFVYRRLAPELVGAVTAAVEARVPPARLARFAESSPLKRYRYYEEHWTPHKAVAFHAAYVLLWFSLLGVALAAAALAHTVRKGSALSALLAGAVVAALAPLTLVHGAYLYDAPELLLWTMLLVLLLKGWNWATIPIFLLMAINKESALIALPAVAVFHWQQRGLVSAVKWTAPLALVGGAWVLYVRHKYAGHDGGAIESWLSQNLRFWTHPGLFFRVGTFYAPALPAPRGLNIIVLALIFLPFRFGWPLTPKPLRAALLVTAVILVPLFVVASYMDEIRALGLLFPLLFVVTLQGVHALLVAKAPSP